jgi:hypothetical protein
VRAMSGTELSRVRTEFRLPLLEPINKSPLESSRADIVMQSSETAGLVSLLTRKILFFSNYLRTQLLVRCV